MDSSNAKEILYELFPEELETLREKGSGDLWELVKPRVEEYLAEVTQEVAEELVSLRELVETDNLEERLAPLTDRLDKVERLHASLRELERGVETHKTEIRGQIEVSSKASRAVANQALGLVNELIDKFPSLEHETRRAHLRIDNLPEEYDDRKVWDELKELRKMLLKAPRGGNMNRNIWINGNSSVLSRYTDINLIPGANVTITYVNNDTKKTTDVTIASSGSGGGSGAVIAATDSGDHTNFTLAQTATTSSYFVIMNNGTYAANDTSFPWSLTSGNTVLTFNSALPSSLYNTQIYLVCV